LTDIHNSFTYVLSRKFAIKLLINIPEAAEGKEKWGSNLPPRAGLTIWWALRTPLRRGPTGKLDADEGERGSGANPLAENGFGKI